MNESTPLTSKPACNSELNPAAVLAANRFRRGPIVSKISFSLRERQRALSERGVGQAAHLCRDAVFGYQDAPYDGFYDPYSQEHAPNTTRNTISIVCGRVVVNLREAALIANWILFLLVFFEPPYWCREGDNKLYGDCRSTFDLAGTTADGEEDEELYPNSGMLLLTSSQSQWIELYCICFGFFYLCLKFADDGFIPRLFFYKGYKRWAHTSQIVLMICILTGVKIGNTILNPFFRMLLLGTYLRKFQREFLTFVKMIPAMFNILAILGVITVFYAWFGVTLFYDTPQGKLAFPSLPEGVWSLWIMVTTANYPDVMMPSYNQHRFIALYFVSYMLVSFFYLMNLLLAVACNSYDDSITARTKYRKDLSKELLTKAFELLDHEKKGSISRSTIMNVMVILNQDIPEIQKLSSDQKSIFFAMLDKDGSSTINLEEFLAFANVLLLDLIEQGEYATYVEIHLPKIYYSEWYQRLCSIVKSSQFELIVDTILVLNAAIIGMQDYPMLSGQDVTTDPKYHDGYIDTVWESLETIFTVLYCIEAMLKINVYGWRTYAESGRNLYDFGITAVAVIASAYVYYPNKYSNSNLIKLIVMARVLRLGRLLFAIEGFRVIGAISVDIIPAATSVFSVLLFISYFFSWLGMLLFGGLITRDPLDPISYELLEAQDFVSNGYWANNFNDMFSGMNVLFNLLVVNNWTECEIGFEKTSGDKWLVRCFFFSYHILAVIGIGNVVTSFIINAFFQQMKTVEQRKGWEETIDGEAVIKGSVALFDASDITGTQTGVNNKYIARIRPQHLDVETDERAALRELFTRSSSNVASDD
ncbi:hypothetical protein ACHAWO_009393 [Cyclotella atomus]|uniref:EF-hand domain-containing protein n=1 Tax=Cyclotella atomus TaxID=382360 RepID=A0ABD3NYX2_9STRA